MEDQIVNERNVLEWILVKYVSRIRLNWLMVG